MDNMDKLYIKDFMGILNEVKNVMVDKRDILIELDSVIGDGDLGITMSEGFTQVCESFDKLQDEKTIRNFLMKAGFTMVNVVPSTMGTLMGTAIMKSGASLGEKEFIQTSDIVPMFKNAIEGIEKRGKSKRGDKTLLDALYPAMEEAEKAVDKGLNIKRIIEAAYKGSKTGVEDTINMQSAHGKAACFGEKTKGHKDPGSIAIMYAMEGIYNYF